MINLTQIAIDADPIFVIAGIVVTALAAIWGIRKVIKLINRYGLNSSKLAS